MLWRYQSTDSYTYLTKWSNSMRHKVQNMLDQNGEFISRFDELNINSEYFSENTLFTNLNRQRVRSFKKT